MRNEFMALGCVAAISLFSGCKSSGEAKVAVQPVSKETAPETPAAQPESTVMPAPWDSKDPPMPLPRGWESHIAKEEIVVEYAGAKVHIKKGHRYFTFEGKIAIGWHGSYDPPGGM